MMRIAIRADAAERIGSGHVARCLTLADRLARAGARVRFVCREITPALAAAIARGHHELTTLPACRRKNSATAAAEPPHAAFLDCDWQQDAYDTVAALADVAAWDWIVVDHYALDARWEQQVRGQARILVIDDLADRAHACDVLLDQNLHRQPAHRYQPRVPAGCRMLLGPRFALLRPEFAAARERCRARERLQGVLVFFGAADSGNLTRIAVEALARGGWPEVAATVVAGSMNPHSQELQRQSARLPRATFHHVTDAMADLMAAADLAIGAAGTTSWERCCLGLPAIVVSVADNQREVARGLAWRRAAIELDSSEFSAERLAGLIDRLRRRPRLLRSMSRRAARLVDGRGADRVCVAMLDHTIGVRPATAEDAELAWGWRNSEEVRRQSFDPSPIPLPAHLSWWSRALQSSARKLLVGEGAGVALGIVRFDLTPATAVLSIYLDPQMTGLGIGPQLLASAARWLFAAHPDIARIEAMVRADNRASRQAFARAGFREQYAREDHSCFVLEQAGQS